MSVVYTRRQSVNANNNACHMHTTFLLKGRTPKYSLMYILGAWNGYRVETLFLQQVSSDARVDKPNGRNTLNKEA